MDHIAPVGGVYQAGTLSGNPLAMAAGLKTLELISEKNYSILYKTLPVDKFVLKLGLKSYTYTHKNEAKLFI